MAPASLADVVALAGTNPAANAEVSETVPAGKGYELLSVTVSLVQAGAGASQPILVLKDSAGRVVFEGFGSSAAQAISTTCQYTWAPGLPLSGQVGATTNVHSTGPLPGGFVLLPGFTITTVTVGLSANTDYAAPVLYVARFNV